MQTKVRGRSGRCKCRFLLHLNQSAGAQKTRPILSRLVDSADAPHDHVQMMRFVEK
jgi:hypothetical protein